MRLSHLTVPALASVLLVALGLQAARPSALRRAATQDPRTAAEAALAYERTRPALDRF